MKRFRALPVILSSLLLAAMFAGCGGGGTPENSSPVANAGSNHSAQVGDIVSFSGTGTDADGSIVKYEWDFDGDGVYDYSGMDPVAEYAYPAYYNPDGSIDWTATSDGF